MATDDDVLTFLDDEPLPPEGDPPRGWKVVVIDDDPAVHDGTRFALYDYSLNGQGLEILSAHSADEGRALLAAHPDAAVILLDVVMETDTAGLDLVRYIRDELENETVRIILRTGQPGQAPERRVIVDYDINDYKAKTELTADKLFTTLTAALRSYQQLSRMAETRRGLEIIIDAASTLVDFQSMQRLAEGVLTQIASLLNVDCAGILVFRDADDRQAGFSVLAGSGCYRQFVGHDTPSSLEDEVRSLVHQAFSLRHHQFLARRSVLYVCTASGREIVVLLECAKHISDTDRALVEVFCGRLSIAFENVILYERLQEANLGLEKRVATRTRELTLANQRLTAQRATLRRANALKNEILGKIAHDLKNPLSVILGRTEILDELVRQTQGGERLASQVGHIRESAHRLTAMVDALVADAMADALDIVIRREPLDLSALVADVVDTNQPIAERKKQSLAVAPAGRVEISGDPDRLREAVDNLVSNAIKYSPQGGVIRVAVVPAPEGARVDVADGGPGLSPEDLTRLFGRFQRLSAKPTGGESSTGLGLSIAKRIVDLHGGRIAARSDGPGSGTTFSVILPRDEPGTAP